MDIHIPKKSFHKFLSFFLAAFSIRLVFAFGLLAADWITHSSCLFLLPLLFSGLLADAVIVAVLLSLERKKEREKKEEQKKEERRKRRKKQEKKAARKEQKRREELEKLSEQISVQAEKILTETPAKNDSKEFVAEGFLGESLPSSPAASSSSPSSKKKKGRDTRKKQEEGEKISAKEIEIITPE